MVVVALVATALCGCLSVPRLDGDDPDAGVESSRDAGVLASDPSDARGPEPVTPIPPCSERVPEVATVEDPSTGHCYFIGATIDHYDVAAARCTEQGGHVVQLSGDEESTFVKEKLLSPGASWWIGLHASDAASGWTWETGDDLGVWNGWSSPPSGDGTCVELFIKVPVQTCDDGCWNDLDCTGHTKAAICEVDPP